MHGRPEGINVSLRGCLSTILLRWRETLCTDHCAFLSEDNILSNAKIHQYNVVLHIDHYVRWFDIAKDHRVWFMMMQIIQNITDLNCPGDHLFFFEWSG